MMIDRHFSHIEPVCATVTAQIIRSSKTQESGSLSYIAFTPFSPMLFFDGCGLEMT
jgi:hypothetical protein